MERDSEKEAMLKLGCESWYAAGTTARGGGERVRDGGSLCEKVRHEARAEGRRERGREERQREGKLTVVRSARLGGKGRRGDVSGNDTTQLRSDGGTRGN